jgi:hypothetical protein
MIDEPRPEDVETIDGIIKAFYEVISGAKGVPRQWKRDAALYLPETRFFQVRPDKSIRIESKPEYIARVDSWLVENGFFEYETGREVQQYGNVAHVLSTYESRQTEDGPVIGGGKNSVQLVHDGTRWWITAAAWNSALQ